MLFFQLDIRLVFSHNSNSLTFYIVYRRNSFLTGCPVCWIFACYWPSHQTAIVLLSAAFLIYYLYHQTFPTPQYIWIGVTHASYLVDWRNTTLILKDIGIIHTTLVQQILFDTNETNEYHLRIMIQWQVINTDSYLWFGDYARNPRLCGNISEFMSFNVIVIYVPVLLVA